MSKYLMNMINEEMVAGLSLRLMSKDTMNDESVMDLTRDVVEFVKTLTKKRHKKAVKKFLMEHKHQLTPVMKDLITDEIKAMDPGKLPI